MTTTLFRVVVSCGYSTTASASVFQAEDVGSIPVTRTIIVTSNYV